MDKHFLDKILMDSQKDKIKGQDNMSFTNVRDNFVFERVEKLTAALYRITDFVPDAEPLKWELRKRSGELLSHVFLKYQADRDPSFVLEDGRYLTDAIISLCKVACFSENFSTMNFSLLRDEYSILRDYLANERERLGSGSINKAKQILSSIEKPILRLIDNPSKFFDSARGDYKGHYRSPETESQKNELRVKGDHKKDEAAFPNPRRDQIVAFLGTNGKSTIKDISRSVTGCSEKTIQRELASLVRKGVLRREGERRWTTYVLTAA